jgi:hypothetical protein
MRKTYILIPIIVFITIFTVLVLLLKKEKYTSMNSKINKDIIKNYPEVRVSSDDIKQMKDLLARYSISEKEASKLFLPAQKGLASYFDRPKTLKPKIITSPDSKQTLTIAPLGADVMRNPKYKNIKSGVIYPTENYIPDAIRRFLTEKQKIPQIKPVSLQPIPYGTSSNLVERLHNERMNRVRTRSEPSVNLRYDVVIDDEEPDVWSEGARGILLDPENLSMYMGNKGTLNRFNVSSLMSFSLASIETPQDIGRPHCYFASAYGFGQATNFVLERGRIFGFNKFIMAPIACNDGSARLELYRPGRLDLIKMVELPREIGQPRWVAHDPITNYTIIPSNTSVNTLGLYTINLLGSDLVITKVQDCRLVTPDNNDFSVSNVTAGCFRDDGILFLTCNADNSSKGIYKFGLNTERNFTILTSYQDFVDDQIVGITTFRRDIFLMIRNNDFGDDNISIYRMIEPLPSSFSWSEPSEVLAHKNKTVTLGYIKDQGMCGSCWAFATTESLGDRISINNNSNINLSASRLLLCDKWRGHCNGGVPQWCIDFLAEKGTVLESCWDYNWCLSDPDCGGLHGPGAEFGEETTTEEDLLSRTASCLTYQNKCMTCDNSTGVKVCTEVTDPITGRPENPYSYKIIEESLRYLNNKQEMMMEIYNNGPIIASFKVYENMYTDWGRYRSTDGIYCNYDDYDVYGDFYANEHVGDHVIEIVGWGEKTISDIRSRSRGVTGATMTVKYWIIKNSWGSVFGDTDGYWRVAFSDEETGLNTMLWMDNPLVINLGIYRENIYGAMSMLPDPNCPCMYDNCQYRCTGFTLDKKCPNETEWTGTNELCWYD